MLTKNDFFLRYCSRLELNAEFKEKINRLLSQDLDWKCILEKSGEEGVSALIYKTLLKIGGIEKIVPERIFLELKETYYYQAARNTLISRESEHVLQSLEKEEVQVIIFKGLALVDLVYNDIGMRSMADIDILVKRPDLNKLDSVLRAHGYRTQLKINDLPRSSFNAQRNSLLYVSDRIGAVSIHVYWHIVNFLPYKKNIAFKINMDSIWQDSCIVMLGQGRIRIFSTHHNIIYLCLHALQHSYKPLLLLCDINELVRLEKDRINWDNLTQEAISFGLSKYVYYGLYLTAEILEAQIPQKTLVALRPKKISIFEKKFISSVLNREVVFAGGELVYFGMNENLLDKIKFVFNLLFPSREEIAVIKQKRIAEVNLLDYFKRLFSGLEYGFKSLWKLLAQTSDNGIKEKY